RDLTKIGKFGIGFTSIFAIRPEAVLLRTGRHGEYWELLFHPDRTFDKVRIDQPVNGTRITLFKRMPPGEVPRFVQEVRFVLGYWCEHSETPITFADRTDEAPVGAPSSDDPFAAFETPIRAGGAVTSARPEPFVGGPHPERIDRPLTLDLPARPGVGTPLEVRHAEPGLEVVIGFAEPPRYGFYNGGLTLLNTQSAQVLGSYAKQVGHTTFKVKFDRLEHTLTRDNVLHDQNWRHAMDGVVRAHAILRTRLLAEIGRIAPTDEPLGPWQRRLAADCLAAEGGPYHSILRDLPAFRDVRSRPITVGDVRAQEAKLGCVLVGAPLPPGSGGNGGSTALYAALDGLGFSVLDDRPEARVLLEATEEPVLFEFFRRKMQVRRAEELFVAPALLAEDALEPAERRLLRRTEEWLGHAVGLRVRLPGTRLVYSWVPARSGWLNRLEVRVGDFGGTDLARSEVLALNGPPDGRVFLRPERSPFELPAFLNWRSLLVNRHHPLYRAQLLASGEDLDLAAFGLASALLHVEGIEGDAAHRRMVAAALEAVAAAGDP
ncbi:MAG: hypothetical protein ABMB14_36580, partial [Myxococcota bacterium]